MADVGPTKVTVHFWVGVKAAISSALLCLWSVESPPKSDARAGLGPRCLPTRLLSQWAPSAANRPKDQNHENGPLVGGVAPTIGQSFKPSKAAFQNYRARALTRSAFGGRLNNDCRGRQSHLLAEEGPSEKQHAPSISAFARARATHGTQVYCEGTSSKSRLTSHTFRSQSQ